MLSKQFGDNHMLKFSTSTRFMLPILAALALLAPARAQTLEQDSLALVALYNSAGGASWTTTWDLNTPVSTWNGVTVSGGRVTYLNMVNNNLSGPIPSEIGVLTSLTLLSLSNNQLTGPIPTQIGNLTSLTDLVLAYNQLTGSIPTQIGSLTSLLALYLDNNLLTGAIPAQIGNLSSLTGLYLNNNQLTTIPPEIGNLAGLTNLWLFNNQLTGVIPVALGSLTSLTKLYLDNNQLTGVIPVALGSLTSLTNLWLNNNQLTGTIPAALGSLTSLARLYLWDNQLTGAIPVELGSLTSLTELYLGDNLLTGAIPAQVGNLSSLTHLNLYNNQLTGAVPAQIGNLTSLTELNLGSNQLTGLPDLSALASLSNLSIQDNQFTFEDIEPNIEVPSVSFAYSPQDSVGSEIDTTGFLGSSLTLVVAIGGSVNQYQWVKDGADISGATSDALAIPSVAFADTGAYILRTTNDIAVDLTLYSRPINVTVIDTTAPAVPQNLAATSGDSSASLSWNANGEGDLSHYVIYQSVSSGFTPSPSDSIVSVGEPNTSTTALGLTNGTAYYFKMTAVDTSGNYSGYSLEASATPVNINPPAMPTGLIATAGDSSVILIWDANGEGDIAHYVVYQSTTPGFTPLPVDSVGTVVEPTTSITLSGLLIGTTYYFKIAAIDDGANKSVFSAEVSATPININPPAAPGGFAATPGDSSISLIWNTNGEGDLSYYVVYQSTTTGFTPTASDSLARVDSPDTSLMISNLANGTTYFYRIVAVDDSGNRSDLSAQVSTAPVNINPPATPDNLAAEAGDSEVTLSWDANSEGDFSYYAVYQSTTTGFTPSPADTVARVYQPDTTLTLPGLTIGTTYYFKIAAVDDEGNQSGYSDEASATPANINAPSAPTGLVAVPGDSSIDLSWAANGEGDFSHYIVYQSNDSGFTPTGADSVARLNKPDTSLALTGLANGRPYYYRVSAVDSSGNMSAYSSVVDATPVNLNPPAAPTGLTAIFLDSIFAVTWTPNGEGDLSHYVIYQSFTSGFTPGPADSVAVVSAPDTAVKLPAASNGASAYFRLAAVDDGGNRSDYSIEAIAPRADVTLSVTSLTFPATYLSQQSSRGFTVQNTGLADLVVSDLEMTSADFTADSIPFVLPPGQVQTVTVTFSPHLTGAYSELAVLIHNGPSSPDTLTLSATSLLPGAYMDYLASFTVLPSYVNVMFQVTDQGGAGLTMLKDVALYNIRENGSPISETEALPKIGQMDQVPFKVKTVLMLDNSFSIGLDLGTLKTAALAVVDNMLPNQEIAVFTFSETIDLLQDFTHEDDLLTAAINAISLGPPSTNLYGAVIAGANHAPDDVFSQEQIEQSYLIILTDGQDTQGSSTLAEAVAARGNKKVITVGVGAGADAAVLEQIQTIGYFPAADFGELLQVFENIQQHIVGLANSFYWLVYVSPTRGANEHTLEIGLKNNPNTGAKSTISVNFSSDGFSSVLPGVYVNRSFDRLNGIDSVAFEADSASTLLTAETLFSLYAPVYEWASGDTNIIMVNPLEGDPTQAVATQVGLFGQSTTITVSDVANSYSKELHATVSMPNLAVEYNPGLPGEFTLHQNYPNPFNPSTTIQFDLPHAVNISIVVYDLLGREMIPLVDRDMTVGYHKVIWEGRTAAGREVPSGIYIARLLVPPTAGVTPGYTRSVKMLLLR